MEEIDLETNVPSNLLLKGIYNLLSQMSSLGGSSLSLSTKTVDLGISAVAVTLSGASFEPPIIKEPSVFTALQIDGINGVVQDVIQGFVQNGAYYDIIITPLDEAITNVKITVI